MSNSYHFITFFSCFFSFSFFFFFFFLWGGGGGVHLRAPEILEACRVSFLKYFWLIGTVETEPW